MLHERKPFLANARFKAIRPFVMNGVNYTYDEQVDTKGVELRRLRQMYEAFLIDIDDSNEPPKPRAAAVEKPEKKAPAPQGKPALRYKGFGKYEVVNGGGETVAGPMPKDEAEAELAKIQ